MTQRERETELRRYAIAGAVHGYLENAPAVTLAAVADDGEAAARAAIKAVRGIGAISGFSEFARYKAGVAFGLGAWMVATGATGDAANAAAFERAERVTPGDVPRDVPASSRAKDVAAYAERVAAERAKM